MKIAIRGHESRGKEVIQIFKDLGTEGLMDHTGSHIDWVYLRDDSLCYKKLIVSTNTSFLKGYNYKIYTLEEFEKEFPFKIGDRVITITTNLRGIITNLKENGWYYVKCDNGHFVYIFGQHLKLYKEMKEERNIKLTLEKAKEWYKKGGELREIALQAFSEKELNPLPRSWEEFIESIKFTFKGHLEYIDGMVHWSNSCFSNKSIGESSKVCDKHVALFQLEQLRNYWWGDWKPEWDCCEKHVIKWKKDDLIVFIATRVHAFLVFPTKEMAEEFLKCFRDLIERAGDLI